MYWIGWRPKCLRDISHSYTSPTPAVIITALHYWSLGIFYRNFSQLVCLPSAFEGPLHCTLVKARKALERFISFLLSCPAFGVLILGIQQKPVRKSWWVDTDLPCGMDLASSPDVTVCSLNDWKFSPLLRKFPPFLTTPPQEKIIMGLFSPLKKWVLKLLYKLFKLFSLLGCQQLFLNIFLNLNQ